ncbi:DUF6157 family protein [Dyadobacter sp. 676]|uniref:DUF6157 family protein n=1 Tax=Dyadobacter sp. 676 TaxID=3088362 RepID=A0AAU8FJX4_9BACT
MKVHTTNYENAFIEVAEDCPAAGGEVPPMKSDSKTVAAIQYEMISKNPYKFTSDDVIFQVFAERKDLTESELEEARKQFFSRGQACMRASPLTKRYGWGVHHDENGKIALYACDSPEYKKFIEESSVKKVKAMRSSR